MPDEKGTDTTRSDAASADESLFGDSTDDAAVEAVEEEASNDSVADEQADSRGASQDSQGSGDAEAQEGADEQGAGDAGEQPAQPEGLKVVVSIKGGRATIGVQQTSSDPHIETFDDLDEAGLTQEVPAVIERARARWEETPKHPAYAKPAPPARRRNRRGQGSAQGATATEDAEQAQQQTLRLF